MKLPKKKNYDMKIRSLNWNFGHLVQKKNIININVKFELFI
jgi:hypothetical protein